MISLPNFAEYAESVNSVEDDDQKSSCNQEPISMEFTFEEHDILNDILRHAIDSMDVALGYSLIDDYDETSGIRQRYEVLQKMKDRSLNFWVNRFN